MLLCFCLTTGMAPTVVAAEAAQEVTVRGEGDESSLGLSDASELSLICVLGRAGREGQLLDTSLELRKLSSARFLP